MKNEDRNKMYRESSKYIGIGSDIIAPILLGALIGHFFLDKNYNSSPKWTIILTIIGFVLGMYSLFKTTLQINNESKKKIKKHE